MNIYLTETERRCIELASERLGSTQAYVARLILRKAFGLSIGERGEAELHHLLRSGLVDMSTF